MKKAVLLLGMGYTGCNTVDSVYADLLFALQTKDSPLCRALAFDTHHHDLQGIKHAAPIQLANMAFASPGRAIETAEADLMRTLFDIDSVDFKAPSLFLDKQGRKTACLAFYHILNEPMRRRRLHQELDELIAACEEGEVTLFTVASLAGDTGAGTFLPITLYVKDYLTKRGCTVKAKALLARPDCYPITDPQKKEHAEAVAYATFKELNAIHRVLAKRSNDRRVRDFRIGHRKSPVGLLFDSEDPFFYGNANLPFQEIFLPECPEGERSIQTLVASLGSLLKAFLFSCEEKEPTLPAIFRPIRYTTVMPFDLLKNDEENSSAEDVSALMAAQLAPYIKESDRANTFVRFPKEMAERLPDGESPLTAEEKAENFLFAFRFSDFLLEIDPHATNLFLYHRKAPMPLADLEEFNEENGKDNYHTSYQKHINRVIEEKNDRLNPHLGTDLYRPYRLPPIKEAYPVELHPVGKKKDIASCENILLVGLGGLGAQSVDMAFSTLSEGAPKWDLNLSAMVFDTDYRDMEKIGSASSFFLKTTPYFSEMLERMPQGFLSELYGEQASLELTQTLRRTRDYSTRKKSQITFFYNVNRTDFYEKLEKTVADHIRRSKGKNHTVYFVTSLAGSFGSGALLPIAYTLRKIFREMGVSVESHALFLQPSLFHGVCEHFPDQKRRMDANAYATLREIDSIRKNANALALGHSATAVKMKIGHPELSPLGVLYDSENDLFGDNGKKAFENIYFIDTTVRQNRFTDLVPITADTLKLLIGGIGKPESDVTPLEDGSMEKEPHIFTLSFSKLAYPYEKTAKYILNTLTLSDLEAAVNTPMEELSAKTEEAITAYVMELKHSLTQVISRYVKKTKPNFDRLPLAPQVGFFSSHEKKEAAKERVLTLSHKAKDAIEAFYQDLLHFLYRVVHYQEPCFEGASFLRLAIYLLESTLLNEKSGRMPREILQLFKRLTEELEKQRESHNMGELENRAFYLRGIPEALMQTGDGSPSARYEGKTVKLEKSYYHSQGALRFVQFQNLSLPQYMAEKTDPHLDSAILLNDAEKLGEGMEQEATKALITLAFGKLIKTIEAYAEIYRSMLSELSSFVDNTQSALQKSLSLDSTRYVHYVKAEEKDFEEAYEDYLAKRIPKESFDGSKALTQSFIEIAKKKRLATAQGESFPFDLHKLCESHCEEYSKELHYAKKDGRLEKKSALSILLAENTAEHSSYSELLRSFSRFTNRLFDDCRSQPHVNPTAPNRFLLLNERDLRPLVEKMGYPVTNFEEAMTILMKDIGLSTCRGKPASSQEKDCYAVEITRHNTLAEVNGYGESQANAVYYHAYLASLEKWKEAAMPQYDPHTHTAFNRLDVLPAIEESGDDLTALARGLLYRILSDKIRVRNFHRDILVTASENGVYRLKSLSEHINDLKNDPLFLFEAGSHLKGFLLEETDEFVVTDPIEAEDDALCRLCELPLFLKIEKSLLLEDKNEFRFPYVALPSFAYAVAHLPLAYGSELGRTLIREGVALLSKIADLVVSSACCYAPSMLAKKLFERLIEAVKQNVYLPDSTKQEVINFTKESLS